MNKKPEKPTTLEKCRIQANYGKGIKDDEALTRHIMSTTLNKKEKQIKERKWGGGYGWVPFM